MGVSLGELFVNLGFNVDDAKLRQFSDNMGQAKDRAMGLAQQIYEVSKAPLAAATAMQNFTAQTGAAIEGFQKWARVVSVANPAISFENAMSSYAGFQAQLEAISQGRGAASTLSRLGIEFDFDAKSNPDKVLDKMAQERERIVKEYGISTYTSLLNEMGIGAGWDAALKLSAEQRDKSVEGMLLTNKEIADQAEAAKKVSIFTQKMGILWNKILARLINAPSLVDDLGKVRIEKKSSQPTGTLSDNQKQSIRFWKNLGFSDAGVAAMVGNEQGESGFNPAAVGDGGKSVGAFQWDANRRAKIKDALGINIGTASHYDNLRAAAWELEQMGLLEKLKNPASAQSAVSTLVRDFERSKYQDQDIAKRTGFANDLLSKGIINQTNTFNIQSNGSPKEVAQEVGKVIQDQNNRALATINLGASY